MNQGSYGQQGQTPGHQGYGPPQGWHGGPPPHAPQRPPPKNAALLIAAVVLGGMLLLGGAVAVLRVRHGAQGVAVPSATAAVPEQDRLERACGVSRSFESKYVIRESNHADYRGTPRFIMRVSVPRGLTHEELQANMRHALLKAYELGGGSSLGAVNVLAYASPETEGAYSAASGVFAPGGDWAKADSSVWLSDWRVSIEFAPSYFEERPAPLAVGTPVVLGSTDGPKTVLLSRNATSWTDADAVARVPVGTKAHVTAAKEFNAAEGRVLLVYEVAVDATKQRGWVRDYAVRAQ